MACPIRIEFSRALYHITSRGDRRESIYEDDADRERLLDALGEIAEDFNWVCHAWCLKTNHYHLVIETPDGNLSKGMRQLNGVHTQYSNRRHRRVGHLFQGRYKAILVDGDSYCWSWPATLYSTRFAHAWSMIRGRGAGAAIWR